MLSATANVHEAPVAHIEASPGSVEKILTKDEFLSAVDSLWEGTSFDAETEALFCTIPEAIDPSELIRYIFLKQKGTRAKNLLDKLLAIRTDIKLSSLETIAYAILSDRNPPFRKERSQYTITNERLLEMLIAAKIDPSTPNLQFLQKIAFDAKHPLIYTPTWRPEKECNVCYNLLWVQKNPSLGTNNIFDTGDDNSASTDFLDSLRAWTSLHEGGSFNIWFDSSLVTETAARKTLAIFAKISEEDHVDLRLRDIRHLKMDPDIEKCFHPSMPVYFRVDLTKLLIGYSAILDSGSPQYCVVTDVDVKPQDIKSLFDAKTVATLKKTGHVFGVYDESGCIENSFGITDTKKRKVTRKDMDVLKHHMNIITEIKSTIAWQRSDIGKLDLIQPSKLKESTNVFDSEFVFTKYPIYSNSIKVIEAPPSQFSERTPADTDHQAELAFFPKLGDVPHVVFGRTKTSQDNRDWVKPPLMDLPY